MIAALIRRVLPERFRPIGYLTQLVRTSTANQVRQGPFAGMQYIDRAIGSAYLPKLLGTYECELAGAIEEACAREPRLIIDVGAAEGYYAVGLALRNPQARVVGFEQLGSGRVALASLALLNGVRCRIEIKGRCDPAELQAALDCGNDRPGDRFLICDAEGDERRLLDPVKVPVLQSTAMLVETHDFIRAGTTQELRRRFSVTHSIECIRQTARSGADFPFYTLGTSLLPKSYLDWAMSEWRPVEMCWLWMKPRD